MNLVMMIPAMASILQYCYNAYRISYTINLNAVHAYQLSWFSFSIGNGPTRKNSHVIHVESDILM